MSTGAGTDKAATGREYEHTQTQTYPHLMTSYRSEVTHGNLTHADHWRKDEPCDKWDGDNWFSKWKK